MVRSPAPTDVFNAIADEHRREILDFLVDGETPVGSIVDEVGISQPQVSKHLRVLSDAGLVRCRAVGRQRLYRLDPTCLRPLNDWASKFERLQSERFDRLDQYLTRIQRREVVERSENKGE